MLIIILYIVKRSIKNRENMSSQRCTCEQRYRIVTSDDEIVCSLCGTTFGYQENRQNESKFDPDGNSQRHHESGILGTDLTKTASRYLRKVTGNHPVPDKRYDEYTKYALRCLKFFLKSDNRLELLRLELENRVIKRVQGYVKIKKETRESIEKKRFSVKHKDRIINTIHYPAIDILLRNVIVEFCSERKEFAINIKPENIKIHKTVKHTKNGNNGLPRGVYKDRFEGLKDNTCAEHGRFEQKSHRQHWLNIHCTIDTISYPTYLDRYVTGYLDWRLKKNKNQILAGQKNSFSKISKKCQSCGAKTGLQKKTVPRKWKKGRSNITRTYDYMYEYHEIIIGGVKCRINKCPAQNSMAVCV